MNAQAGVILPDVNRHTDHYGLQPRPQLISVCFVGNATDTRPQRVEEIKRTIKEHFESAANLKFDGFDSCAAPRPSLCGDSECDFFPGDIRLAIPGAQFKGKDIPRIISQQDYPHCADYGAASSWAVFPENVEKPSYRACPYNMFIGDDGNDDTPPRPWVNHTLHEVGHSLGLVHEFAHPDFDATGRDGTVCKSLTNPGSSSLPVLTPVDLFSVMMYTDNSCGIPGNYSNGGLSAFDRLTLHILYPETDRVAEYVGTTVVKSNQPIELTMVLKSRGALINNAIKSIKWKFGKTSSSRSVFQSQGWSLPGKYTGRLQYTDFLDRKFSVPISIRVLLPKDFNNQIVGPITTGISLL